jgi:hypothetical protein
MLVLDFVGNSGKHKLIHATDVLGIEYSDQELEDALREIKERSDAGEATDVEDAFRMAAERREAARRQKELEDAKRLSYSQEVMLRERFAERRRGIIARAQYGMKLVDAFAALDVLPQREPGWHKGRKPSPKMLNVLRNAGLSDAELGELSFVHAKQLIRQVIKRRENKLCTLRQAKLLQRHGYDPGLGFDEANRVITELQRNGWKRTA